MGAWRWVLGSGLGSWGIRSRPPSNQHTRPKIQNPGSIAKNQRPKTQEPRPCVQGVGGLRSRALGLGCLVLDLGCWVQGVEGFGARRLVLGAWFRVLGALSWVLGAGCWAFDFGSWVQGVGGLGAGRWVSVGWVLGAEYLALGAGY